MRCLVRLVLLVAWVIVAGCGSSTPGEPSAGAGEQAQEGDAPGGGEEGAGTPAPDAPVRGQAGERAEGPASGAAGAGEAAPPSVQGAAHSAQAGDVEARAWGGCAVVHLGFDLRALPHGTRGNGVDMYVRSRAQDLADLAGAPEMRMAHIPGTGVMWGFFDAVDEPAALSRCERAVVRYLEDPPLLPVIRERAVIVVEACRPCDPPADAADAAP